MNYNVFTIVLDGMPFIKWHLERLQATNLDWRWNIVEGVARPTMDTSWVKGIPPRLSIDGTTEYLDSITDSRVKVLRNERWANKTAMCNAALAGFRDGVLLQMDVDEVWEPHQHEGIHNMFEEYPLAGHAYFWCNYFLGPDIIATSRDGYGNRASEWLRAWRFKVGQRFLRHEPPKLYNHGNGISRDCTKSLGLVFNHYSWYSPEQVKAKCNYYGGKYTYEAWAKLQSANFPVANLLNYLPWVGPGGSADKIPPDSPILESRHEPDEKASKAPLRSRAQEVVACRHPLVPKKGYEKQGDLLL